ncbi:MAG: cytochrome c [Flavobacteriales bacterium]|nr:cytochrome c [Flavobacteriales bacterium]
MKVIVYLSLLVALGFFAACGPPDRKSNQVFWDPDKDTAWQEHLAQQKNGSSVETSEGKKLFDMNCASCHFPDKDMTGPALKGARERWIENSSEENFYAFIQNSQNVIKDGDSYANELFRRWNNTVMTPHNVTKEEIDKIFDYVENFFPTVAVTS